jgi:hypothetical protein
MQWKQESSSSWFALGLDTINISGSFPLTTYTEFDLSKSDTEYRAHCYYILNGTGGDIYGEIGTIDYKFDVLKGIFANFAFIVAMCFVIGVTISVGLRGGNNGVLVIVSVAILALFLLKFKFHFIFLFYLINYIFSTIFFSKTAPIPINIKKVIG